MFNKKIAALILAAGLCIVSSGYSQTLEKNYNDFLHYTSIGRYDLAKGYAQAVLQSNPDPVELLEISKKNPQGYEFLLKVKQIAPDAELGELSSKILEIIDQGGFTRRADPAIIVEEVKRLSSTERGWLIASQRLHDAGEYAIPFMLDAMSDPSREEEFANIVRALPKVGRDAIRPLAISLQTDNIKIKARIIEALGEIRYPQALACLKYIIENDSSTELQELARKSIAQIDPVAVRVPAAQLFFQLAESYYYHAQSLSPAENAATANIWFWDSQRMLPVREAVDKDYFNELMAMRSCEWALKSDAKYGPAIGLWLAAYFKAESAGVGQMPEYFGPSHADAFVYATTAGVEYLHQALARAIRDKNAYVALGIIEALGTTAGEKSLMYRIGQGQPLIQALSFDDKKVRYSAAIAIAAAGPKERFVESKLVVANLAEALRQAAPSGETATDDWNEEIANSYALRSATVMYELARTRNPAIDLSLAQDALVNAVKDERNEIKILAGQSLAYLASPGAQRAIAEMALDTDNTGDVRISAFVSLATSAKLNANMLPETIIDSIYDLIKSDETDTDLRSAAAAAFGALNLPSQKVKDLILDQAKS